ncbi:non-hydrolyzing UDP-N-acetylglucosamine 2-epimerase [Zobellia uliginosa]|uniref:non-hydrolyzing UDP-N-acetylglucosamine 2-epimerase n=1 Tax=Zobellia uliginosa TaxID=143224 RepID=UPI001C069714|nr:UDP-N-acetylglucosamine 2-epimerase (non-hydrolyzing) [Zobellia uliginosa]MBU2948268.1 UDP-N-acetylglucosamine 2-epimerase (non-hydrolyzing) [Zobellia uliginosa]
MKIVAIIGARPQFIKHFPFELACKDKVELITIHTGQHYDDNMSEVFFTQLKMSTPNYTLHVGSGAHGEQTGKMMIEIEKIINRATPDGVVIYGDTNSTLAGALVASKLHIPIFHIEAGLRSFNKKMPEEVNRVLTDHISDLLFVPSAIAVQNLKSEGIEQGVFEVGDIMKDLVQYVTKNNLLSNHTPKEKNYYYTTIHRPYNTDNKDRLGYILDVLNHLDKKVIFSLHPRTKNLAASYRLNLDDYSNINFIEPQSYFSNLGYLQGSEGLITDSGGMQKEAFWLKKKCVTIRKETEWKETLIDDANILLFDNLSTLQDEIKKTPKSWNDTLYGDGNSASKMVGGILQFLN